MRKGHREPAKMKSEYEYYEEWKRQPPEVRSETQALRESRAALCKRMAALPPGTRGELAHMVAEVLEEMECSAFQNGFNYAIGVLTSFIGGWRRM